MIELTSHGPTDDRDRTGGLRDALSNAGHIYLGPGQYMVAEALDLLSYTRLTLHPEAVLRRASTMHGVQALRMTDVRNIVLEGGRVFGAKADGFGGYGQCAGVTTSGATDVVIRDMEIYDWPANDPDGSSYGYGLYLGSYGKKPNRNVLVSNVRIHGCGQDQFHMASGVDVTIENCRSWDGHPTQGGFDIEPGVIHERIQNLLVRNCLFEGAGYGLVINNHYSGYWHDIVVENCKFQGNKVIGFFTTGGGSAGLRVLGCVSRNNLGNEGFYIAAWNNVLMANCEARGNLGHGIYLYECSNSVVRDCDAVGNGGHGILTTGSTARDFKSLVVGCGAFNNAQDGIRGDLGLASTASVKAHVALCRVGNAPELAPPVWAPSTEYYDDTRVINAGNVYELVGGESTWAPVNVGTSAASGGPTGTGSAIEDGTCVWKYIMPVPVQQWGISTSGESFRGMSTTRNTDCGNALGFIREHPLGDSNTLFTTDVLESQLTGQRGGPLTRARAVALEDKTGTPGNVTSYYAAGRAAIAAAASSMTIATPFAAVGDLVQVTQEAPDATLTRLYAKVTALGTVTVQGDAAATATVPFAWEILKAGSFPYDL